MRCLAARGLYLQFFQFEINKVKLFYRSSEPAQINKTFNYKGVGLGRCVWGGVGGVGELASLKGSSITALKLY